MNTPTSSAPGTPTPADDRVDGSSSCLELLAAAPADVPDLPILDEVPLLGSAMELLRGIDRLVAQLLEVLIELEDQ